MVGGHSPLQSAPASPNPPRARQEGEGRAFISSGAAKRQFPKNPTSTAQKVQEETHRARDQAPAAPAAAELPKPLLPVPPGPHEVPRVPEKQLLALEIRGSRNGSVSTKGDYSFSEEG